MRLRVASRKQRRDKGDAKERSTREEPLTESEVRFECVFRKDQSVIEFELTSSEARLTRPERLPAVVIRLEARFNDDKLVKVCSGVGSDIRLARKSSVVSRVSGCRRETLEMLSA